MESRDGQNGGRRRSRRSSSIVFQDWRSLPSIVQGSLLFYASHNFYFNKWIQSDFLSMLLVQGSKGDSEETVMRKALIMTSADLAAAMHEVKLRAAKVLIESTRTFLNSRKERQRLELERQELIRAALEQRPPKPWRAIEIPDRKNVEEHEPKRILTGKELWRTAANRIIFAERMSGAAPKQKFRASPLVDAAASGNLKLLEEFLIRRSSNTSASGTTPSILTRRPSRQARGSIKRLSIPENQSELSLVTPLSKSDSGKRFAALDDDVIEESLNLLVLEDLNAQDITRKTPLQAAIENNRWDCMMLLLKEPDINISVPDLQTGDSIVHTILASKVFRGALDLLRILLGPRYKFDVNMKNRQGATILAIAASNSFSASEDDFPQVAVVHAAHAGPLKNTSGSASAPQGPAPVKGNRNEGVEILKFLLSRKADVNATDNHSRYPVEHAAAAGILEYVRLLAEHPSAHPDSIHRALFAAIPRESKANMDIIQYLICEKGASVQQGAGKQDNVLIVASRNNQIECVRTLLNWPFISRDLLKARNADRYTALHAAVHECNNPIAIMLMKSIFGHSVLDEQSELGLKKTTRKVDRSALERNDSDKPPPPNPRSRANNRHMQGRRGALIVATSSTDSEVVDSFLFSVAAQVNNVEMIEHLLFEGKGFKDTTIQVPDRTHGTVSTNLICWSVRQRNKSLLNLLLNFGADINAVEVEGFGLFPLMIAVKNLAAPPWSRLAMEVLQVGKDTPCITMSDMVNIVKRSKWDISHIADTLQDSKGNPLKSPTGRQLFSRNTWKFSWYGFQAICAEVSMDLKSRVEKYTNQLDVSLLIYENIINSPQINIHQEVGGQTAAALAVECGNWKVFEDLRKHGARICHPSVIQACAENNCIQRLNDSLNEELSTKTLTEENLRKIFDLTCEAGHVECAQLLFEHGRKRNLYLSVQEQLLKAATDKQHWMIDFLLSKDRTYATKGKALLICAENGDFRSLQKLLAHGADPDFQHEASRDADDVASDSTQATVRQRRPITIAGEYWGRSGSRDHYEVVVSLLRANSDVAEQESLGRTILMWACLRGHVRLAEFILATLQGSNRKAGEIQAFINMRDSEGKTAIMHAVLSSCEDCVDLMLKWNANVDITSSPGKDGSPALTVLGHVTTRYREKAPAYLLQLVAKSNALDARDENQSTLVAWAARYGHTEAVKVALELNSPSKLGIFEHFEGEHSALELACMCKRREICSMLIRTWNPEIPVPDSTRPGDFVGISLFQRFIEYEWEDVTLELIEHICPLDVKSQVVVDALQNCVRKGWLPCIQALLKRGVSPNSFSSSGHSPLVVASQLNHIDTVKCLLENRATGLEAAAIVAIHLNHLDCFQILFQSIDHSFEFMRTTACIASLENNVQALKLILAADKACDMHIHLLGHKLAVMVEKWIPLRNLNRLEPSLYQAVVSDNLAVPLLCAVAKGSLGCTAYLLQTKADPLATDENGISAMVWASAVGNLEIVKVLLRHGAVIVDETEGIMPFFEMKIVYNITVIAKIEGRMKKLLRKTLQTPAAAPQHEMLQISVPPLLVALMKGHTDVVRLLLEAGADTKEIIDWCNETLHDEPKMEPYLRSILECLVLYEDYKAYGPFGIQGHSINNADVGKIPDDGRIFAVVAQFSKLDWSLIAIQFVHEVSKALVECEIHSTSAPKAGDFRGLHPYAHVERLDLEEHEYIIQAELGIAETHIQSLRFTTNLRVTKWLGGKPIVPRHRVVTVAPVGREIVGIFSCVLDRYYLMGFLTRLRLGDFPWRSFRSRTKRPVVM